MTAAREKKRLLAESQTVSDCQQAQEYLQKCAERVQQSAHGRVSAVVSKCVNAVFPGLYELRIEFVKRRGRTEAEFAYFTPEGNRVDPRLTSGGVREVASLALRLVSIVMSNPPRRKLLVLDEPFRGVSGENLPKVAALIESIGREMEVQFLIVSHCDQLQVGKVIQLI